METSKPVSVAVDRVRGVLIAVAGGGGKLAGKFTAVDADGEEEAFDGS